jgi:glutamate racemase
LSDDDKPQEPTGSSVNLVVGSLIFSVFISLSGYGAIAGLILAVLTTASIFVNRDLRERIQFPIIGILAVLVTAYFTYNFFS